MAIIVFTFLREYKIYNVVLQRTLGVRDYAPSQVTLLNDWCSDFGNSMLQNGRFLSFSLFT